MIKNILKFRHFTVASILLFITLISLWWHYLSWESASLEYSTTQSLILIGFVAFVIFVQIAILLILHFLSKKSPLWEKAGHILAAVFLTINVFSLLIVNMPSFAMLDGYIKLLLVAISLFVAYTLLSAMKENRLVGLAFVTIAAFLLIQSVLVTIVGVLFDKSGGELAEKRNQYIGKALKRDIKFKRKPNVYLISFDAMAPESVSRDAFGDLELAYARILERPEMRKFRNAFSDRVPTQPCLNSILTMDLRAFDKMEYKYRFAKFNGKEPSLLFELFRRNGYKTQSIYKNNFFGKVKGQYVDFYGTASTATQNPFVGLCEHAVSPYSFLGLCHPRVLPLIRGRRTKKPAYPQYLFDRIEKTAKSGQPWLTISHIYFPGHTLLDYTHNNIKKRSDHKEFLVRRSKIAAKHMDHLLKLLKKVDPSAIFLTYGDHGAWASRGMKLSFKQKTLSSKKDRSFFIQDRHGINMAIWPQNTCKKIYDKINGKGYITISQAVRGLVTCLSDGKDPLADIKKYHPPYGKNVDYKDYLYE